MPNLIHILFCMVVGIIVLSVITINLLRDLCDQSEETVPDNLKINQEKQKVQAKQKLPGNLDNKEYNRFKKEYHQFEKVDRQNKKENNQFEKELVGIYNYLEAISERDALVSEGSNHSDIYQAFDAGLNITDLARKFKKDKGEIELILNLRSRDDQEVAANG